MNFKDLYFRHFLLRELELRQQDNSSYSTRAFARDLGTSSQMMSQILSGKNGISVSRAKVMAEKLHLSEKEKVLFVALVQARHHRDRSLRQSATETVKQILGDYEIKEISAEKYKEFLKWYFNPIILLVEMPGFKSDMQFISKKLNLDHKTTEQAVQRLFEKGFLVVDEKGAWKRGEVNFTIKGDANTPEIRDYYVQFVEKAKKSITEIPVKERDISTTLINIDQSDLPDIQNEIRNFRQALMKKITSKTTPADQIYSLCIQFFPITSKMNEDSPL